MKKILYILIITLFSIFCFNNTFAENGFIIKDDVNIYKIYKDAILTRHQIKKDFINGDKMNQKIEKYFINLYFKSDRKKLLLELENKLSDILKKTENKMLSIKEKKTLNVIKNLYYRTIIELRKK